MTKKLIKQLIQDKCLKNGMTETGIKGVKFFYYNQPLSCSPAIYEPAVIAILSGSKEAIIDGRSYIYDNEKYMCCSMSMPVEAGVRKASKENPLMGIYISLDTKVMTELAIKIENSIETSSTMKQASIPPAFTLANWDQNFTDSLLRLLQLEQNSTDINILGDSRLREVYYAILKGQAGESAKRAYGIGNQIARTIRFLSSNLNQDISIEIIAKQVGMSRAVLHRKFKEATSMSPIQFVKSMRLNNAAMKISTGMSVSEAALEVGYQSASQFSREFKRLYGESPKQWVKYLKM